ncbi:unnamed protein product [Rhodiola kirilowii]
MADSAKGKNPINPLEHQPPNLKTWVLKASIHCEGCKKKVKKIVSNTPGVYSSDVDLKQQKVTVTGNIDVNTLISKLIKKTGKHAELWPEVKTEQDVRKQSKQKPKRKPPLDEVKKAEDEVTKEKPKTGTTSIKSPEKNADQEAEKTPATKTTSAASYGGGEGGVVKQSEDKQVEPISDEKKEESTASKTPKETVDSEKETGDKKKTAVGGGAAAEEGSASVCKKNKKKGQNGKQKLETRERANASDATNENQPQYHSSNQSPPRHYPAHMYGPPPSFHAPPVYTVSYNTTPYPASSYGASYYAMPPPHTEAYAYSGSNAEYRPSNSASYQSQPSETFELFSDENPNACSLM